MMETPMSVGSAGALEVSVWDWDTSAVVVAGSLPEGSDLDVQPANMTASIAKTRINVTIFFITFPPVYLLELQLPMPMDACTS
jgi:hypothetical protein